MKKREELNINILNSSRILNSAKSQVALEFMMTYGWGIMIALVSVSAIAYFGVLNPDRFFPTACTLETGIGCADFKINEGPYICTNCACN